MAPPSRRTKSFEGNGCDARFGILVLVDDVTSRLRHADKVGLRCVRLRDGREEGRREEAHLLEAPAQKPVARFASIGEQRA